jgi:hypothetical protein
MSTAKTNATVLLVDDVRPRAVAPVIQDLGQGHAVDARGFGHLLDGDAPGLPELLLLDLLSELETDHAMLRESV